MYPPQSLLWRYYRLPKSKTPKQLREFLHVRIIGLYIYLENERCPMGLCPIRPLPLSQTRSLVLKNWSKKSFNRY